MAEKVYEKVYDYYLALMREGSLKKNDKMPSLRECTKLLGVSRTSVETAYLMLAADGYIYSIEKVGYYVTDLASKNSRKQELIVEKRTSKQNAIKYDFATIGEDATVSCIDLWRRYMKSALRQELRLLSYSENQGEYDLRVEISAYVRRMRNIICDPEDIVIGAGFQNLLTVLVPLLDGEKTVSFPTKEFHEGAAIFEAAGYEVTYRNKDAHIINVTPAYMKKWGEVMTMKRRQEMLEYGRMTANIIIEDDYQNEFVFSNHQLPSLYALSGGENVVYMSSFSRVLLPSVRISFMILPKELRVSYESKRQIYNQSCSKAEQIALAQFLRDGHMLRHIRKMRRVYEVKREIMYESLEKYFKNQEGYLILYGESGMEIGVVVPEYMDRGYLLQRGVSAEFLTDKNNRNILLLSCGLMEKDKIEEGIRFLSSQVNKTKHN